MRSLFKNLRNLYFDYSKTKSARSEHILYRIVNVDNNKQEYTLQYLNSKTFITVKLTELVFNKELLYSLYPEQACYVGIKYANYCINNKIKRKSEVDNSFSYMYFRYGKNKILHHDRNHQVSFMCIETKEIFSMDPREIVLSPVLIREFDASQAFHMGVLAEKALQKILKNRSEYATQASKCSYLRVVK